MWSQYLCIKYGLLWPLFHMIMRQLLFIFVLSLLDSCSSFLCYHKVFTSVCSVGEMFTHFIFFWGGGSKSLPCGIGFCSLLKAVRSPLFVLILQYTCCRVLSYRCLLHISFHIHVDTYKMQ